MARLASVAVAGYFPTPQHLISRIACLFHKHEGPHDLSFLDPCAGDGAAILALMGAVSDSTEDLFACEMEATRFKALKEACERVSWSLTRNLLHGDAFTATFDRKRREGISLLFLNPPYDLDKQHGRLEEKFLRRFTGALALGGVLVFVVPHYALKASAATLATEYGHVKCYKFPDEDFKAFKQVVLVATKTETRTRPDYRIQKAIIEFAEAPEALPELPNIMSKPVYRIPAFERYSNGLEEFEIHPTDVSALIAKARPWCHGTRIGVSEPVRGVLSDRPVQDILRRVYPVATPPRPAHIAAGIASGVFNGALVTSNEGELPDLLVKGVFTQEYRTIEEKTSADGDTTNYVQVQQPKLVVTVLDLASHKYHTLSHESGTGSDISTLTIAGLLHHYDKSLMAVMEEQCPVLYDPRKDGDAVKLAETKRVPYRAQQHAAKAIIRLLGGNDVTLAQRRGRAAILLGEIGSGKTTVALAVSASIYSRRPLVVCPPHLLDSWRDEVAAVLPDAEFRVLTSIADLEAVAADNSPHTIVSVLSRETAKLSHGWEGVGDRCPTCGQPTPKFDLAKKRARCEVKPTMPVGYIATLAIELARKLSMYDPTDSVIQGLLPGRLEQRLLAGYAKEDAPDFKPLPPNYFDRALMVLRSQEHNPEAQQRALVWLLLASGSEEQIAKAAEASIQKLGYGDQEFGRSLLLMLTPGGELQKKLIDKFKNGERSYSYYDVWGTLKRQASELAEGKATARVSGLTIDWSKGSLEVEECEAQSLEATLNALHSLERLSGFEKGPACGGFLFQAIPEPRRIALAQHIQKRFPTTFDMLVLDEAHEYSTDGSAQERAAHRLTGLKLPTILMTGSIMNGYAESLFATMWAVSPKFRQEFGREDKQRFIDRYGYRKRLVTEEKLKQPKNVIAFGSNSDRVETSDRVIGNAPGVLPLFLLQHLLPISVTLHKEDLALDLPKCHQSRHLVQPTKELKERYTELLNDLTAQIKKDTYDEELVGKLFGQLAELPSYLDRATNDTGNTEHGDYEIRYPESVGGDLVTSQVGYPANTILPKEQWMLDRLREELAEGRNVMVFSWHVTLLPRIAKLIEAELGVKVPILFANKVATGKRQEWINKNVVKKGARVLVTNPVAIQTGLNNLVHFSTQIWMENPACNPIITRQATGRVDRIGQTKETRILFPVYAGTLQEQLHDLLLHKVAVSTATDGLDPESALLASGVGPDAFMTGMSIGKQLWAMLSNYNEPIPDSRVRNSGQKSGSRSNRLPSTV